MINANGFEKVLIANPPIKPAVGPRGFHQRVSLIIHTSHSFVSHLVSSGLSSAMNKFFPSQR